VHFLATLALTGYLFISIPKGFFPQQDTGAHHRHIGGGSGRVVRRDDAAARGAGRDLAKDPAVATAMALGAGGASATLNNGRFLSR
jgi:HAE1 family hydrophobic/amphiphilic exporter-1